METPRKKIHRFFVPFDPGAKSMVVDDTDLVHQWKTVLRFRPGEIVQLFSDGIEVDATITKIGYDGIELLLARSHRAEAEPTRELIAYVSMFKKEPFEWMLEKLTEIGVKEIQPIESARTVRFPWRPDRFKAILKEAAEQCGRGVIPTLHEPVSFDAALKASAKNELNVIFDSSGSSGEAKHPARVGMFIGPEGGFTDAEISSAVSHGFVLRGLGKLTLRAETAALVGAYKLLQ